MIRRYTGPDAATRDQVIARTDGRCQRCQRPGAQIHHRKPRGMGGSRGTINALPNLVLLCYACHRWVESYRLDAYATGWLVHRPEIPADVTMIDVYGRTIKIGDDGSVIENR